MDYGIVLIVGIALLFFACWLRPIFKTDAGWIALIAGGLIIFGGVGSFYYVLDQLATQGQGK